MSESEKPNTDMPDEILRDILSRLPVKQLLQFKSVSKHWNRLISDTHFVNLHLKKSLNLPTRHRILVPTSPLLSLTYNNPSPNDITTSIELRGPFLKPRTAIKILGSSNGLVCFIDGTRELIIYNPSTQKYYNPFQSPRQVHCTHRVEFVYGFGCGLNPDDTRLVRFTRFARESDYIKFKIRGVTTSSWTNGYMTHGYDFIDTVGTLLNGSLHWLAHHSNDDNEDRVIASFNISEETFKDLFLPPQETSLPFYILGVLNGCLSALRDDRCYMDVDVWLMKEYGVANSWMKFVKIPLNTGIENISYMMPLSCLNEAEILLEIDLQSFVIYNVKTKSFRHVKTVQDLKWFGDAAVYVESLLSPEVLCVFY